MAGELSRAELAEWCLKMERESNEVADRLETRRPAIAQAAETEAAIYRAIAQALQEDVALVPRLRELEALLSRIRGWDMLDATADGPYWKAEIDKLLAARVREGA